jgi:hypothetical protein
VNHERFDAGILVGLIHGRRLQGEIRLGRSPNSTARFG